MSVLQEELARITEDNTNEIGQALSMYPINNVSSIVREKKAFRGHRTMRDISGFKSYLIHCTQELYAEDTNLHIEMAQR